MCFVFSQNVGALSCSNKEAGELSAYANFVKVGYDVVNNSKKKTATFNGETKNFVVPNYTFNITVYNCGFSFSA